VLRKPDAPAHYRVPTGALPWVTQRISLAGSFVIGPVSLKFAQPHQTPSARTAWIPMPPTLVRRHRDALAARSSAFFSVSLCGGGPGAIPAARGPPAAGSNDIG